MNVKTISRQAKRLGLTLKTRKEEGETLYTLHDRDGNEIIGANNKRMLYNYLPFVANCDQIPEKEGA